MTIIYYNDNQNQHKWGYMLGTIGFSVATVTFLVFGYSSYKLAATSTSYDRSSFLAAYVLIALACLVWAVGIQLDTDQLRTSILVGDALLLLGSTFLAITVLNKKWRLPALALGALVTVLMLVLRVNSADTAAAIVNNVLVFNTPRAFGLVLVAILYFVWVRANMYFFTSVIDKNIQVLVRPAYFSSNLLAFIGVTGFLFARKDITIIVSFCMIVAAFISLLVINNYAQRRSLGGAHAGR